MPLIHLHIREDGEDHEEHAKRPAEIQGGHANGVRLCVLHTYMGAWLGDCELSGGSVVTGIIS
jgi:hypothetical protein